MDIIFSTGPSSACCCGGVNIHNGLKFSLECPRVQCSGPLLFLIYINDLPDDISATVRLFADDCVLYSNIKSHQDRRRDFKMTWTSFLLGKINGKCNSIRKKCFVLRIAGSRSPIVNEYTLGGTVLQETHSHSYLGVEISQDLKWDTHIVNITSSANKINGFIRRNLFKRLRRMKPLILFAAKKPNQLLIVH